MGPKRHFLKNSWGRVFIITWVFLGMAACGGGGTQKFTLKAQFLGADSSGDTSQISNPKSQVVNSCEVTCETALLTGQDTDLLQLPTNHVVDCDENRVPLSGTEITIVEGVSLKTEEELLTVQVCCNPTASGNILNDLDFFNLLGYCGDLQFAPGACTGGCNLDVGLNPSSAEDVASLGCFVINTGMLALYPLIGEGDDNTVECTLLDLLLSGSVLADCKPPPDNILELCQGSGDGGNEETTQCGNGIVEETQNFSEECDPGDGSGSEEANQACRDLLGDENAFCVSETCICFTDTTPCGNNQLDEGEECDYVITPGDPGNNCSQGFSCAVADLADGDACTCIDCSEYSCEGGSPDGICDLKEVTCGNCPEDCSPVPI